LETSEKPIANPLIVLREEFDDWAILFNPDTGKAYGLNPTGVYLWKLLDGQHSPDDLVQCLRRDLKEVSDEAPDHIKAFLTILTRRSLAGYHVSHFGGAPIQQHASKEEVLAQEMKYERPVLKDFFPEEAKGEDCYNGSTANPTCGYGNNVDTTCYGGSSAAGGCGDGYYYGSAACSDGSYASGDCGYGAVASSTCSAYGNQAVSQCGYGNHADNICNEGISALSCITNGSIAYGCGNGANAPSGGCTSGSYS